MFIFPELMARAKRERVVQDEVEKANRRPTDPTRPDTTRHPKRLSVKLMRSAQKANVIALQKYVLRSKIKAFLF